MQVRQKVLMIGTIKKTHHNCVMFVFIYSNYSYQFPQFPTFGKLNKITLSLKRRITTINDLKPVALLSNTYRHEML